MNLSKKLMSEFKNKYLKILENFIFWYKKNKKIYGEIFFLQNIFFYLFFKKEFRYLYIDLEDYFFEENNIEIFIYKVEKNNYGFLIWVNEIIYFSEGIYIKNEAKYKAILKACEIENNLKNCE
jgi:hypothetical protein